MRWARKRRMERRKAGKGMLEIVGGKRNKQESRVVILFQHEM
jgi:hypothetical protein